MKTINITDSILDDLIWMSYRYCIGRHTIASCMHADDIIQLIKDNEALFDTNRLKFYHDDIISTINDCIRFCDDIVVSGLNHDLFKICIENVSNDLANKKLHIESNGSVELVNSIYKKEYIHSWKQELKDLVSWHRLAMWIDGFINPVKVTVKYQNKQSVYDCFKWYGINGKVHYSEIKNNNKNSWFSPEYIINVEE